MRGSKTVTTADIEEHLEDCELIWVETPHFRIGSSLEDWTVPMDREVRDKVRAELAELKERTGWSRVSERTKRLDPWLRLHLMAQRLESHYARLSELLGVKDEDFPADDEDRASRVGKYMGEGPYLGQKGKYLCLMFEEMDHLDTYLQDFTGRRTTGVQHWNFVPIDALMWATAADNPNEGGAYKDDTAMHAQVIHSTTHQLLNGYLHYNYDMPVWIREGIAHWFQREVSPRYNSFTRGEGAAPIDSRQWRWDLIAKKLAIDEDFVSMAEACQWRDFGQMDFEAHVSLWSRWDFLMTKGPEKFAQFIRLAKGQIDPLTGQIASDVLEGTRDALKEAYGYSPLTLDEAWRMWAVETYPSK